MTTTRTNRSLTTLIGLATCLGLGAQAQAQDVAITNARVIDSKGVELKDATVLVKDGRIVEIGPKVKVPYDATEIDAKGKVVFPGMVLADTSQGMDRANESVPVGPYLNVLDSIDPSRLFFEESLREGHTTLHVIQGEDAVVTGLGRAVHPLGMTVSEMTVRGETALRIVTAGKRGFDRVKQRALLRETFAELTDYVEGVAEKRYAEEEKKEKREVTVPPAKARELGMKLLRPGDLDDKHRNLWLLTQGKLDAFVSVPRAQDAAFAVQLAQDNGFLARTTFVLGTEAHKAVAVFKAAKRPVILDGNLYHRERDPLTGEEEETFVPAVFAQAKVPFALVPDTRGIGGRYLWYQAARCVREGVDRATALQAITSVPAAILGLAERKGEIAKGRDADLLILSGDPLEVTTSVEQVLIGGRVVYERAKDYRLRMLNSGAQDDDGDKESDDDKKSDDDKSEKSDDDKSEKSDDKTSDDDKSEKSDDKKDDKSDEQGGK